MELALTTLGALGGPAAILQHVSTGFKVASRAVVIKVVADLYAAVDLEDLFEASAYERYLKLVHNTVCDVSGQPETDFYDFLSVAGDATPDEIWSAEDKAAAEAPSDVRGQKADGVSRADLIAIVLDVLEDETKRGQYDRVLERIRRRGSGNTSWPSAIVFGWCLVCVEYFLSLVRIPLTWIGMLPDGVRLLLAAGQVLFAGVQMLLAWLQRAPTQGEAVPTQGEAVPTQGEAAPTQGERDST